MKTDYEAQAEKFLADTGTQYKAEFKEFGKHFGDDKDKRFLFTVTLTRGSRSYSFDFGSSLADAEEFFKTLVSADWKKHFKYPARVIKDEEEMKWILPAITKHKDKIIAPSAYDVLACLTKYDPGTFEDFCGEFGYDVDSKKAEKVYEAVKKEYLELSRLYNDQELEALQDIN